MGLFSRQSLLQNGYHQVVGMGDAEWWHLPDPSKTDTKGLSLEHVVLLRSRRVSGFAGPGLSCADNLGVDPCELIARLEVARQLLELSPSSKTTPHMESDDRAATQLWLATHMIVELERQRRELAILNARLAEMATIDPLTGLKTRRHLLEALENGIAFATRQSLPLSLIMFDLDHFKECNDTHGHPKGDQFLKCAAQVVMANSREGDVIARYGGEEFIVMLLAADAAAGTATAERLRRAISQIDCLSRPVTASFGVTTLSGPTTSPEGLIDEADQALLHSKREGRNRVTHYGDLRTSPTRQIVPMVV